MGNRWVSVAEKQRLGVQILKRDACQWQPLETRTQRFATFAIRIRRIAILGVRLRHMCPVAILLTIIIAACAIESPCASRAVGGTINKFDAWGCPTSSFLGGNRRNQHADSN